MQLQIDYTQETPNPAAYKFVLNHEVLANGVVEITEQDAPTGLAWADALLALPQVVRLYLAGSFLTVIKTEDTDWAEVAGLVRETFRQNLRTDDMDPSRMTDWMRYQESDEEAGMTNAALAEWFRTRVLPGTEKDGGGIFLESYEPGHLTVALLGACKGCPYAPNTINDGILPQLKKVLPPLKKVDVVG